MKKVFLFFCVVGFLSFSLSSQETNKIYSKTAIGDVFKIADVAHNSYKHIDFPRANFVIKKGGIYTFKNIIGKKVVITSIKQKADGTKIATIKLKNGGRFFNSHKYLKVDLKNALLQRELVIY
ncbi:dihydroorotase [uncultured Polaribacter sp.]|uniref:dihydroorotase n=1 Tax=uncultured Polaribacter sp. TaxID=174711 RepID=UPI0026233240|nr:dihydroorotase [uncultured Polaribacter sp.]